MVNYYAPCDVAIKNLNREIVEEFGRLKMAKWDEVNIIRSVATVYRQSAMKARKRYYEVAAEAYILAMIMIGEDTRKAHAMADKKITQKWVDEILDRTDAVTLYRFNTEAERKAYRLAEQLEVGTDRNRLIDRAMKEWSRQVGQFAITFTDEAVIQAFMDAGVEFVEWVSEHDQRTCGYCKERDGLQYPIDEIPTKPHYGCRCRIRPVKE